MSNVPADLKYSDTHEWAKTENDGTVRVGITDHAQKELGDLVYVELPAVGERFEAGDNCGTLESVKAVAELVCPFSGTILARNEELYENPEAVNGDPYSAWMFAIRPDSSADLDHLLDAAAYTRLLTE